MGLFCDNFVSFNSWLLFTGIYIKIYMNKHKWDISLNFLFYALKMKEGYVVLEQHKGE